MSPTLHATIEAYGPRPHRDTVLLNTSFNLAGEPIVPNRAGLRGPDIPPAARSMF